MAEEVLAAGDESALQDLLDRHGPGRVMFRNTRAVLSGFPKRIADLVPLKPDPKIDPRVRWLAHFLRENPDLKVLVICHTREEVGEIDAALRGLINVKTALFHEV